MTTSLWPTWFPYPRSWLRAIVLMVWMLVVMRLAIFWGGMTGLAFSGLIHKPETILIFLGVSIVAAFLVFAYLHHFLLGKPPKIKRWPKHFPSPKSLWEGFFAAVVMILALAVGIACVMPFHDFSVYTTEARLETEGGWFGAIWFVTATYLYQAEFLIRRRHNNKTPTA